MMHCGKLDFGKLSLKAWDGDGDDVADVHSRLKVAMGTISLQWKHRDKTTIYDPVELYVRQDTRHCLGPNIPRTLPSYPQINLCRSCRRSCNYALE